MNEQVPTIEGKKVLRVERIHDYVQVVFDDISSLRIYNKYELVKTNILAIDELVDKVALSVNTTVDAIEIIFWPETILKIGLHETDFNGPEAAQFISSEGNRVVWN